MAERVVTGRERERGQATPEYVGLVLLAAAMLAVAGTLVGSVPGGDLTRAIASKLVCAVKGSGDCGEAATDLAARPTPIQRAYGGALAAIVAERVPAISFEEDEFVSLPVDFRECRERACSDSIRHGSLEHTQTGLQPTAFTHVIDCRDAAAAAAQGLDCSDWRAGNLYVQYWLYYPESWTRSYGRWGFHEDDWESYQVRIGADGAADARASSHQGYNGHEGGLGSVGSDLGKLPRTAWEPALDELHVAAGSHAGTTRAGEGDSRRIEPANLRILPLEPIVAAGGLPSFEVTPPWEKEVWRDPEAMGT